MDVVSRASDTSLPASLEKNQLHVHHTLKIRSHRELSWHQSFVSSNPVHCNKLEKYANKANVEPDNPLSNCISSAGSCCPFYVIGYEMYTRSTLFLYEDGHFFTLYFYIKIDIFVCPSNLLKIFLFWNKCTFQISNDSFSL